MELINSVITILWDWKAWIIAATLVFFGWAMLKKIGEEFVVGVFRFLWLLVRVAVKILFGLTLGTRRKGGRNIQKGTRVIIDDSTNIGGDLGTALYYLPRIDSWTVKMDIEGKIYRVKAKGVLRIDDE